MNTTRKKWTIFSVAAVIICAAVTITVVTVFSNDLDKRIRLRPQNQQTPLTAEQLSGDVKTIELMGKTYTASFRDISYIERRDVTVYNYTDGNGNLFSYNNLSNHLVGFYVLSYDDTSSPEMNDQTNVQAEAVARAFAGQFVDLNRYGENVDVFGGGSSIRVTFGHMVDGHFSTGDFVDVYMHNDFKIYSMYALEVGRYDNLQMPDSIDQQVSDAIAAAVSEARGSDAVIDRYAYKNGFLNVLIESDHQYHIHGDVDVWLKDAQAEGGVKAEPVRVEIDFPFQPAAS